MYYKYRAVNERTDNYFIKKEIWAAEPSTLNDPFECNISIHSEAYLKEQHDKIKSNQLQGFIMHAHQCRDAGKLFYNLQGRQIHGLLKKIEKSRTLDQKYKVAQKFLRSIDAMDFTRPEEQTNSLYQLLENVGVFSLSEDPLHTLMWSHYGDSHRGIALGFDAVEGSDLDNAEYFQPVQYSDAPLNFDFEKGYINSVGFCIDEFGRPSSKSQIKIQSPQVQKALFTKTKDWQYEKEWRYVREKFGSYPLPGNLVQVIFGLNCPYEVIDKYHCLCSENFEHEIKFYKVLRDKDSTKLSMTEIRC